MSERGVSRDSARTTAGGTPFDRTVAAPTPVPAAGPLLDAPGAPLPGGRSTVLPRVEHASGTPRLVLEGRPRYQSVRPLGAGGQAEVDLVRDHDIDRPVARKRMLPGTGDDAALLRFAEEIRTVGQLEHPNIVPIHDVGVDEEGQYFFVMKYVEGETLEQVIAKLREGDPAYVKRYTIEHRIQICGEILRGVEHAHQLGYLHRDLKPANVMIGSLGEVVIMDWGLAKRTDAAAAPPVTAEPVPKPAEGARLFETEAGALLGTPAYMAPEQAAGRIEAMDARSEVFSLAAMFYELFCLRHPHAECTGVPQMLAAVAYQPITVWQVIADFGKGQAPAALGHFVRHGLALDPAERYPTVQAMRERLDEVREGRMPIECQVTFTQRLLSGLSRAANRHPAAVLATLFVSTLAVAGGLIALTLLLLR